jgi:hypothetical protein
VTNKQICPSVPLYVLDLEYSPTSNFVSLYVVLESIVGDIYHCSFRSVSR